MEDEYTRRIDDRIRGLMDDAQSAITARNMIVYSSAMSEIRGLKYAKEIYIAMKTR